MPELAGNLPYQNMLSAALERLRDKDLAAAAANAGMTCDLNSGEILFESFGEKGKLFLPELRIEGDFTTWQHMAVLQYLELDEPPMPSGEWVSIRTLEESAASRGASFDRKISSLAANRLGRLSEKAITNAFESLGGEIIKYRNADLSAVFHFLPNYPYLFNFWFVDEEFPANAKALIDARAGRALGLEAAGTMAELLVERICSRCESGNA